MLLAVNLVYRTPFPLFLELVVPLGEEAFYSIFLGLPSPQTKCEYLLSFVATVKSQLHHLCSRLIWNMVLFFGILTLCFLKPCSGKNVGKSLSISFMASLWDNKPLKRHHFAKSGIKAYWSFHLSRCSANVAPFLQPYQWVTYAHGIMIPNLFPLFFSSLIIFLVWTQNMSGFLFTNNNPFLRFGKKNDIVGTDQFPAQGMISAAPLQKLKN